MHVMVAPDDGIFISFVKWLPPILSPFFAARDTAFRHRQIFHEKSADVGIGQCEFFMAIHTYSVIIA
jgi:hypothetical protein